MNTRITKEKIQHYSKAVVKRREVLSKKGVLRNFAKLPGKHLYQSLFLNKVAGLRPAILLKNRLRRSFFPVNFAKFSRTRFFTEHLPWLLLIIHQEHVLSGFKDASISKRQEALLLLFSQL